MSRFSDLGNALYSGERSYDFIGKRKVFYGIAGVMVVLSFILPFLLHSGFNFGIEFKGGSEFRVAGGPYTVPISINNASRISVLTLTVTPAYQEPTGPVGELATVAQPAATFGGAVGSRCAASTPASTPATSGASGPTTTKSTPSSRERSTSTCRGSPSRAAVETTRPGCRWSAASAASFGCPRASATACNSTCSAAARSRN